MSLFVPNAGALICVLLGGAAVSAICLQKSMDTSVTSGDTSKIQALQAIGIIFAVLTFLYFCAIIFMRDRIAYVAHLFTRFHSCWCISLLGRNGHPCTIFDTIKVEPGICAFAFCLTLSPCVRLLSAPVFCFRLAIVITSEASKVIRDIPSMVFFPILPFVCVIGYAIWWIYTATLLFAVKTNVWTANPTEITYFKSIGLAQGWPTIADPSNSTQVGYYATSWNTNMQSAFCIHFFHLLWQVQFFVYFSFLVRLRVGIDV